MKKILKSTLLFLAAFVFSISLFAQAKGKLYGKSFKIEKAIPVQQLAGQMGDQAEMPVVLKGEISQVCQAEGCWMKMKNEDGADVLVKFKDHAFLIPKDLASHHAYVNGVAIRKTVSVEEQQHLAEDAGKSADEIATITEPKEELRIDATGVMIH
ncbi:MAG TPA: DUF4920 domain-containing protein [Flavipsychrobacter sp.]|nr:DUF4920 domain-containing protein [Flavipsychrobacter sp.]